MRANVVGWANLGRSRQEQSADVSQDIFLFF